MKHVTRILVCVAVFAALFASTEEPARGSDDPLGAQIIALASDVVDGTVTGMTYEESSAGVFTVYSVEIADAIEGSLTGTVQAAARGGVSSNGDLVITSGQPVLSVGDAVTIALVADNTLGLSSDILAIVGGVEGVNVRSVSAPSTAAAAGDFALTGHKVAAFPSAYQIDGTAGGSTFWAAIRSGVSDWETQSCSTVDFSYSGLSSSPVGIVDGVNAIGPVATGPSETFVAEANLVLAANGDVVEWDVRINFSDHSFAGPGQAGAGTYDLASVVRHEMGEVLGLGPVTVTDEVMSPVLVAEEKLIGLGDKTGIASIYPVTLHPFTDVAVTDSYHEAVGWLFQQAITTGTSPTTFSPSSTLIRAEAVTFLWRDAGFLPGPWPASGFADVPSGIWFETPVDWALDQGITTGTGATTFSPSRTLNRSEIVTMLYRANGSPAVPPATHPYTDLAAPWYTDAVQWAFQQGLLDDIVSGTTFLPEEPVSRAEMALFLWRNAGEPSLC